MRKLTAGASASAAAGAAGAAAAGIAISWMFNRDYVMIRWIYTLITTPAPSTKRPGQQLEAMSVQICHQRCGKFGGLKVLPEVEGQLIAKPAQLPWLAIVRTALRY